MLRAKLQEAVQNLLGIGILEDAWEQVCLPIACAARLAVLVNLELNGAKAVGMPANALVHPAPDLHATLGRLQAKLRPNVGTLAPSDEPPPPEPETQ